MPPRLDDRQEVVKHPVIHLLWLAFVLLLAISALVIYSPDGNVIYNYVSFASAISSILLAIVAILYSMISNQSLSSSILALQNSSHSIDQRTRELDTTSAKFSDRAEELIAKISEVPSSVEQMSTRLGSKIDSLATLRTGAGESEQEGHGESYFDSVKGKTIAFGAAIYCVYHGYKTGRTIRPFEIFPDDARIASFFAGFFAALRAFEPCGLKVEGHAKEFSVKSLGSLELSKFVEGLKNNNNKGLQRRIASLNEYLGIGDGPSED